MPARCGHFNFWQSSQEVKEQPKFCQGQLDQLSPPGWKIPGLSACRGNVQCPAWSQACRCFKMHTQTLVPGMPRLALSGSNFGCAKCTHLSLPLPHECWRGRNKGAASARSAAGGGCVAQDERQADHGLAKAHLICEHTPAQLLRCCWRLPLHHPCACSLHSLHNPELCGSE